MDFTEKAAIDASDSVIDHPDGFQIGACCAVLCSLCREAQADATSRATRCGASSVCDPKSLLYLFGMQLDYSNALIGGSCLQRFGTQHSKRTTAEPLTTPLRLCHRLQRAQADFNSRTRTRRAAAAAERASPREAVAKSCD
jgi:Fe-S cluster assembly iron-binding protein IscA